MSSVFAVGQQPCDSYTPQMFINAYGSGRNEHSCYGPFGSDKAGTCTATVSFCESCHRDHHAGGYQTCPVVEGADAEEDLADER